MRRTVKISADLVRLATVRFAGQFGDGMFQAALSGAILFNPERETDPLAVAAGFAVLLLPYSLLGPFAGALLDRWNRRAVLVVANVVRAVLVGLSAAGLAAGFGSGVLLAGALAVVGVGRFVAAGVSAAVPHVVSEKWLVTTNSVLATASAGFATIGASTAVAVISLLGAGDRSAAIAALLSASGSVLAAVAAASFARHTLGPGVGEVRAPHGRDAVRAVAAGLRTGALAAWRAPEVTTTLIGIGAHRIVFGADTLLMVLVLRETASGVSGGLVGFGVAIASTAAGMLTAAVVAPVLIPRLGRSRTVVCGLVVAAVVQLLVVAQLTHTALLIGAFLLGLAGQTIKLTGDAAMQLDLDDDRRGQVFALQDTVFNVAFVLAVVTAAALVAPDGQSPAVAYAAGGVYVLALIAVAANTRRRSRC
ncbi:MAG TPA: MFS transporter [Aldersonia sp.]